MSVLIILRGNSASGKTTTAHNLQRQFAPGSALVISQDLIRREMLQEKDRPRNKAIAFMRANALLGKELCDIVIIEGITNRAIYRELFEDLAGQFEAVYTYYFDLPYEETVKRHRQREKSAEFGEAALKSWWLERDLLHFPGEKIIDQLMTEKEIVALILNDLEQKNNN